MPRTALYFLATPLFAVADLAFRLPVRVAGLAVPWQRTVYYLALMALGLLVRARPALAPWAGMAESSVNLALLLVAILSPIWSMPDAVLSGAEPQPLMGGVALTNALISGFVLVASFQRHRLAAERSLRGRSGGL